MRSPKAHMQLKERNYLKTDRKKNYFVWLLDWMNW